MVVDCPAERSWALLTAWERQGEWIPATRVRAVGAQRVGGRICAWTGIGRVGFRDPMKITRWEPPHLCEVLHTGRVVRGPGRFEVHPLSGGRSRVVWEEDLHLPFGVLGRLGWPVAKPAGWLGLRWALRRFRSFAIRQERERSARSTLSASEPRPGAGNRPGGR